MQFLHSILSLPTGELFAIGGVVAILLLLWISALFSRRLFVTLKRSEETELIAFQLRRIADATERLAAAREAQAPADTASSRPVGMSMFGR